MESKHLFEILVREHIASVRAFLLASLRDPTSVEDLVQETFLVAWRHIDRYDRALPFGPWVRGIASKLLWNHRRKQGRGKVQYVEESELRAIELRFDRLAQLPGDTFEERVDALRQGMDRLTEAQRSTITLHYQQGLQCREIAQRLGIGNEAVKKHLQRGRAALMRELDRNPETRELVAARREA
ncbi:MAG: RNA polymerase sigma factor [Planctomycetota bacterium]